MFSSKALPPTYASVLGIITHPGFLLVWMAVSLSSYWYFDEAIAFYIRGTIGQPVVQLFDIISFFGKSNVYLIIILPITLCALLFLHNQRLRQSTLLLSASLILPGLFCDVLKILVGRYRPRMLFSDQMYGFHGLTFKAKMLSFPSGHAVTIMGLMVALSLMFPRQWYWFWAAGLVVSASRIVLGAHFLSDVMMGMYIGAIGALLSYIILRFCYPRFGQQQQVVESD